MLIRLGGCGAPQSVAQLWLCHTVEGREEGSTTPRTFLQKLRKRAGTNGGVSDDLDAEKYSSTSE